MRDHQGANTVSDTVQCLVCDCSLGKDLAWKTKGLCEACAKNREDVESESVGPYVGPVVFVIVGIVLFFCYQDFERTGDTPKGGAIGKFLFAYAGPWGTLVVCLVIAGVWLWAAIFLKQVHEEQEKMLHDKWMAIKDECRPKTDSPFE